ncbi:MAG: hypothetical protein AB8B74_03040 [Crocinitomicaceae bacterium]
METIENIEVQPDIKPSEPKKSKRKLYALIALVLAVLIYFLVPSGAPSETTESSDLASIEAIIAPSKVKIISFEGKKRIIGKWVINGVISNNSDAPIESIEFEAVFSDNAELVTYRKFIDAEEKNHEFTIKVTGHKGENLNNLKIREVRKSE